MVELLVWLAYSILHNPELRLASYNAFRRKVIIMTKIVEKGFDRACNAKLVVVFMMLVVEVEVHGFFKVKVGITTVQSAVTSLDSSPIYDGVDCEMFGLLTKNLERKGSEEPKTTLVRDTSLGWREWDCQDGSEHLQTELQRFLDSTEIRQQDAGNNVPPSMQLQSHNPSQDGRNRDVEATTDSNQSQSSYRGKKKGETERITTRSSSSIQFQRQEPETYVKESDQEAENTLPKKEYEQEESLRILANKIKQTVIQECKTLIKNSDNKTAILHLQNHLDKQFDTLSNEVTTLSNQKLDIPDLVTDLNICKADIKEIKQVPITADSDIRILKEQYHKLENSINIHQQQQSAIQDDLNSKIIELTEKMNQLKLNPSNRIPIHSTPPNVSNISHRSTSNSSAPVIANVDQLTEVHKLLWKSIPATKDWEQLSGEGESNHLKFILYIDTLQEDYQLPDNMTTTRLGHLFKHTAALWYMNMRQTNGQ
ncbi:hypothetical protein PPACK8108_LOCUS781 [Phakopsora pachyrhizi]|uniref:Uncharacterized protein n=1 Tax=Phakopsora pachyrhizi TaxID=170000 RepID=A0AAV0AHA4_PHAPC|nr:hypothetical protein PPACK8108_LOCUS781 [Phakopsora pachyrhizi]